MMDRLDEAREQLMAAVASGAASARVQRPKPRRRTAWALGIVGGTALVATGIAAAALEGRDERTEAITSPVPLDWNDLYGALREPVSPQDRLVVGRGKARYEISSARRLLDDTSGRTAAYAYTKGEELCLAWQDREHGAGSSSCRTPTEVNPPAVVVLKAPEFRRTLVATMVPDGASIEIRALDGSLITTPVVQRNFVAYEGDGAFNLVIGKTASTAVVTIKARPGAPG